MLELNGVACGDQFTAAATISDVIASSGGYFAVSGNDVFVALQYHPSGSQGQPVWTREAHAPIGNGVLAPGTTGVRFRNYVAGSVGIVSASLSERAEPPITLIAGGASSPSPTVTFLGAFTQAQWPPLGALAQQGDAAELADTYGGATWGWLLENVPNIAPTKPWRPYGGLTPSSAYFAVLLNVNDSARGWTDTGASFQIPVAGDWSFDIGFGGGVEGGVNRSASTAIGTTAAGHDIATATNIGSSGFGNAVQTLNTVFTATKGQTIHVSYQNDVNAMIGLIEVRFRPVALANA